MSTLPLGVAVHLAAQLRAIATQLAPLAEHSSAAQRERADIADALDALQAAVGSLGQDALAAYGRSGTWAATELQAADQAVADAVARLRQP